MLASLPQHPSPADGPPWIDGGMLFDSSILWFVAVGFLVFFIIVVIISVQVMRKREEAHAPIPRHQRTLAGLIMSMAVILIAGVAQPLMVADAHSRLKAHVQEHYSETQFSDADLTTLMGGKVTMGDRIYKLEYGGGRGTNQPRHMYLNVLMIPPAGLVIPGEDQN